MKLILKSHLKKLPRIGETEYSEDPVAYVKLFNPCGIGTWFITEYDPEEKLAFGLVDLNEVELGYFSLKEIEELRVPPFGLKIERDIHFKPTSISKIKESLKCY